MFARTGVTSGKTAATETKLTRVGEGGEETRRLFIPLEEPGNSSFLICVRGARMTRTTVGLLRPPGVYFFSRAGRPLRLIREV